MFLRLRPISGRSHAARRHPVVIPLRRDDNDDNDDEGEHGDKDDDETKTRTKTKAKMRKSI